MTRLSFAARVTLALCLGAGASAAYAAEPVASVPQLDISRYAGQWHEIAHLPMFFQRQCVGDITARYSLDGPGKIGVLNACRTKDGSMDQSSGTEVTGSAAWAASALAPRHKASVMRATGDRRVIGSLPQGDGQGATHTAQTEKRMHPALGCTRFVPHLELQGCLTWRRGSGHWPRPASRP